MLSGSAWRVPSANFLAPAGARRAGDHAQYPHIRGAVQLQHEHADLRGARARPEAPQLHQRAAHRQLDPHARHRHHEHHRQLHLPVPLPQVRAGLRVPLRRLHQESAAQGRAILQAGKGGAQQPVPLRARREAGPAHPQARRFVTPLSPPPLLLPSPYLLALPWTRALCSCFRVFIGVLFVCFCGTV